MSFGWARRDAPKDECVCPNSPARLLAKSLTDPETRGEWKSKFGYIATGGMFGIGCRTEYTNASRDLSVTRSAYGVTTPFTLNEAEQEIVKEATKAFDKWKNEEREQAALARLLRESDGSPKGRDAGSTAKPRQRGAKRSPKRR